MCEGHLRRRPNNENVCLPILGYAFLLFRDEVSVHRLVKSCLTDEGKLFMYVSSVTQTNKKVRLTTSCSFCWLFVMRHTPYVIYM